MLDVVRRPRAADLPIDVVHLDTFWFREDWRNDLAFSQERFPDPAAFLAELRVGIGEARRRVYLPAGRWEDWWTGEGWSRPPGCSSPTSPRRSRLFAVSWKTSR